MIKFICLMFVMVPLFAHADSYFVEPSKGASFSAEVDEAKVSLNELIKSDVSSEGHTVVRSAGKAQWVLQPALLKMGRSFVVTLSKIRNGSVAFSQKLKARSLEDLDTVSARLVKSVVREQTVASTQQVNSVTQEEQRGTSIKTEVTRQFYFGFGPGNVSNVQSDDSGVNWTFGYLWGLEDNFSLRLGLQGTGAEDDARMTSFGLGGQYYFSLDKHAPYALGMVGYSWTRANDSQVSCSFFCGVSDNGWSAEFGGGMHFFRTARVNLALEVAYTQAFYDLLGETPGALNARILVLW